MWTRNATAAQPGLPVRLNLLSITVAVMIMIGVASDSAAPADRHGDC
jgi:hypothetical protein